MALPLEGVRVVDLTHVAAGPLCTTFLGQLGADVVKVERPGGEMMRSTAPSIGSKEISYYFASVNVQKRFMSLDLAKPEGIEVLHRLVKDADVVVQNFAPGVVERLGVDYNSLQDLNPGLIYCSITGFRPGSKYDGLPSFDYIHEALSGVMSMTTYEDQAPPLPGLPAADMGAAVFALAGIMLALYSRTTTGRGQHVGVPLYDSLLAMLPLRLGYSFATGEPFPALGRHHRHFAPFGTFDTADGRVVITVGSQKLWKKFVRLIPDVDLPEFATAKQRIALREKLHGLLTDILASRSTLEWLTAFTEHGVPAAPIRSTQDVAEDSYTTDISHHLDVHGQTFQWIGYPPVHSAFTPVVSTPPEPVGAQTEEILRGLGYSPDEIADLRESGVA